jgi:hypothetical protein
MEVVAVTAEREGTGDAPVGDGQVPDPNHQRPDGATDGVVEAVGKVSEAFEWIERARGRLFDFHQMMGHADFLLGDAADLLEAEGQEDLAAMVREEAIGRNVLDGRWTFQIVEEFARTYYDPVSRVEAKVRDDLMEGRHHVYEAELKEQRRSRRQPGHESRPPDRHPDRP